MFYAAAYVGVSGMFGIAVPVRGSVAAKAVCCEGSIDMRYVYQ